MMTVEAKKKAMMRRKTPRIGDVRRGPGGTVEMIEITPYRENPLAPVILVNKVGGIYRVSESLMKVTFALEQLGAAGGLYTSAAVHLMWTSHQDWLASHEIFRFATEQFERGGLRDDGGGRQPRSGSH